MLKQKAIRRDSTSDETWAEYEQAWAGLIRTPTDGADNQALAEARDKVDALEDVMAGRTPGRTTVQDVIDYHLELDVRVRVRTTFSSGFQED